MPGGGRPVADAQGARRPRPDSEPRVQPEPELVRRRAGPGPAEVGGGLAPQGLARHGREIQG